MPSAMPLPPQTIKALKDGVPTSQGEMIGFALIICALSCLIYLPFLIVGKSKRRKIWVSLVFGAASACLVAGAATYHPL